MAKCSLHLISVYDPRVQAGTCLCGRVVVSDCLIAMYGLLEAYREAYRLAGTFHGAQVEHG